MAEYLRQRAQGSSQPVPVLHVTTLPIDEANAARRQQMRSRGLAARRRGRCRAADCLRQHREPAAVARRGAAARDRGAAGARREPRRLVRQLLTEACCWRSSAASPGLLAWASSRASRRRHRRRAPCRSRSTSRSISGSCSLRAAAVVRDRHPVRHRSRLRSLTAGTRARAQGRGQLATRAAGRFDLKKRWSWRRWRSRCCC